MMGARDILPRNAGKGDHRAAMVEGAQGHERRRGRFAPPSVRFAACHLPGCAGEDEGAS
jgi:hypothetical protein